jgi:hypothetical protein
MFQRDGEGLRRQKRTQTTLRRVVWVLLGMFFFYSCSSYTNYGFYFYVGSIYVLKARGGPGWMAMTKTGPNDVDASFGLVGVFFLFFFVFSHSPTTFPQLPATSQWPGESHTHRQQRQRQRWWQEERWRQHQQQGARDARCETSQPFFLSIFSLLSLTTRLQVDYVHGHYHHTRSPHPPQQP